MDYTSAASYIKLYFFSVSRLFKLSFSRMTLGRENRPRERAYVYIKMEQIVFTKSKS